MAIQPRQMVRNQTLFNAKDIDAEHIQQEVFAALVITGGGTFDKGTIVADTRIDDGGLTGGSTDQGDLIPFLTPLTYDSAGTPGWRVWINGQTIDGFSGGLTGLSLHESGYIQTTDAGEVMGLVIKGGVLPADQVVLPAGESQNNLDAALATGMRAKSFHITNLEGVS